MQITISNTVYWKEKRSCVKFDTKLQFDRHMNEKDQCSIQHLMHN